MFPKTPNSFDRSCQEPTSTVKRHKQFTNILYNLAILVLPCVPNSADIVTVANMFATGVAFSGIIYFYC